MQGERYLLAPDVILAYPHLIGAIPLGAEILVGERTLSSLQTFASLGAIRNAYVELVRDAITAGALRVASPEERVEDFISWKPSRIDFAAPDDKVIHLAAQEAAILVTDNSALMKAANALAVPVLSGARFRERVTAPPPSEKLAALLKALRAKVQRAVALSALTTVGAVYGVVAVFKFAPAVILSIKPWWSAIGIAAAGIFLYLFRSKWRLAYGIAEVVAGIVTGWHVATLTTQVLSLTVALQILAAVYIVVRGLDNIATAWPESVLYLWWLRFVGLHRAA